MEIKELVDLCKSGDEQALGVLYKTYSRKMMRICLHYIPNREVAEDLLHDGFIVIFTSIHSLRNAELLEVWMEKIIKNIALRYISQHKLVSMVQVSELPEDELPAEEASSFESIPYNRLLSMIDRLPEGYGKIFKLSVLEGLSHKEIAELLNIAPHSSSSQLSRAKGLLKKMIADYRMSLVLFVLVLIPIIGGYLLRQYKAVEKKVPSGIGERANASSRGGVPSAPVKPSAPLAPSAPVAPSVPLASAGEEGYPEIVTRLPLSQDSLITQVTASPQKEDTVYKQPLRQSSISELSLPSFSRPSASRHSKWKLMLLGSAGSQLAQNLYKWIATPQFDGATSGLPQQVSTWEEYYAYLRSLSESGLSEDSLTLMKVAENNSGPIVERREHDAPITFGLSLNKKIDERWSLETGLQYTYLKSTFTTGNVFAIRETQKLHYIGIPLKVSYRLANYKNLSFYSMAGVQVDIPLKGTFTTAHQTDSVSIPTKRRSLSMPWQFSVTGGVGLQYHISSSISIYAEPGIHYYIPDGSSLQTIRKEHPFTFSVPVGVRVSW